jgi:anti-sigma regulatory factor (Ser/Thr protein kinase)
MNNTVIDTSWRFDSLLEAGHEAAARIREICRQLGFPETEIPRIELCVYEAFVNAVEHAYQAQPDHEVGLEVRTDASQLQIRVCQRGVPLDPAMIEAVPGGFDDLADPLDAFDCEHRGRGIRIIKSIMSRCTVERAGDRYCLAMSLPLP